MSICIGKVYFTTHNMQLLMDWEKVIMWSSHMWQGPRKNALAGLAL